MNQSFRASAEPRATRGRTLGTMMKEKEDDLALFLEMRKRDKERTNLFLHTSDELDPPLGSRPGSSPLFKIVSSTPARRTGIDDFLNSEGDKNDYDWLLTPPGTPLFPSLEKESNRSPIGQAGTPKARQTVLKSRLANPADSSSSRINLASRQSATSPAGLNSYGVGTRRPSSSGGLSSASSSRPATPTGRPTLSATSKPSRPSTPTSRASTLPTKPVVPPRSLTPSARSSTLTSTRSSSLTSTRSSALTSTRSSTLTSSTRQPAPSSARSSTPTSRPSLSAPSNKPAVSRSATPTRRSSAPSSFPASSAPPGRSSSVTKSGPTMTSNKSSLVPSRGTSPTVRSRPWKPSDMPGFSLDAPPNLRTSLPDRPSSASRGRPGAPTSRSSSIEPEPNNVRPRRQSCSPSRGRTPNGISTHSGSSVPAVGRSRLNGGDSVSPVLIGSKMVERVVNVRRLAPPKQDTTGKSSSSPDSTGFGRTMSRKSLDMALRHMDIRRSIPNNLRPLMANIPASSLYSVRSGPTRSRPVSVSGSPLATSSNASSEQSFSNNIIPSYLDGSELEDDLCSRSSPAGPIAR